VSITRQEADAAYSPSKVEHSLGKKLAAVIAPAGAVAREAVEQGVPMVSLLPGSEIAAQFSALSDALLINGGAG
jgi:hypothetical protein